MVLQVLNQTNFGVLMLQPRYILYALAILDLLLWACSGDRSSLQALHVEWRRFIHELVLFEGISLLVSQYHFIYCLFILWEAQALIACIALLSVLDFPFDAGAGLVGGLGPEHLVRVLIVALAMASLIQVLPIVAIVDALLLPALSLVVVIWELS